jgi:hypothetical protein
MYVGMCIKFSKVVGSSMEVWKKDSVDFCDASFYIKKNQTSLFVVGTSS